MGSELTFPLPHGNVPYISGSQASWHLGLFCGKQFFHRPSGGMVS